MLTFLRQVDAYTTTDLSTERFSSCTVGSWSMPTKGSHSPGNGRKGKTKEKQGWQRMYNAIQMVYSRQTLHVCSVLLRVQMLSQFQWCCVFFQMPSWAMITDSTCSSFPTQGLEWTSSSKECLIKALNDLLGGKNSNSNQKSLAIKQMKWNSLKAKTQHTAKAERINQQNFISFLKTFQQNHYQISFQKMKFLAILAVCSWLCISGYVGLDATSILIRHYPASTHTRMGDKTPKLRVANTSLPLLTVSEQRRWDLRLPVNTKPSHWVQPGTCGTPASL